MIACKLKATLKSIVGSIFLSKPFIQFSSLAMNTSQIVCRFILLNYK